MRRRLGTPGKQALKIVLALALSLLGLSLLPVLALPYGDLDWVDVDPAYQEGLSAPGMPRSAVAIPRIPCLEPPAPGEPIVARVNGQSIGHEIYAREMAQFLQAAEFLANVPGNTASEADTATLRRRVLGLLIDDVLVQQAAIEAGITVSSDELQAHMAGEVFRAGGPEMFRAWLQDTGQDWEEYEQATCLDLLRQALCQHIAPDKTGIAQGTTAPYAPDPRQVFAFEEWLAKRREAAEIEFLVDPGW
jgi:hypothetical protein